MAERIEVHEVGLRDGLQNIKTVVPTDLKLAWIKAEARGRRAGDRGLLVRAAETAAAVRRRRGGHAARARRFPASPSRR